MKIESIKVKNFRTLDYDEFLFLRNGLAVVGPNSSGKSNILKSVELLFTGFDDRFRYSRSRDFPHHIKQGQTSITANFLVEDFDGDCWKKYNEMNDMLVHPKDLVDKITVYLVFGFTGRPSYRLFSGEKRYQHFNKVFNNLQREVIQGVLNSFECWYIPSSKDVSRVYTECILPKIKEDISCLLAEQVENIEKSLNKISDDIAKVLIRSGFDNLSPSFRLPMGGIEGFLGNIDYFLSDPECSDISTKGMGVQSVAMLSAFSWVSNINKKNGKSTIWLVEEPEAFLHPDMGSRCNSLLQELGECSQVFFTTHNVGFIPTDMKSLVGVHVDDKNTMISKYSTYKEAAEQLRGSLGVKLSDYLLFGEANVFLEGRSDRDLFYWVMDTVPVLESSRYSWVYLRQSKLIDLDGTPGLENFVKTYYNEIKDERAVVICFDGDEAGVKCSRNICNYLSNRTPFRSNKEYVLLPRDKVLEGLFPSGWIKKAYKEHEGWFKDFILDSNETLISFSTKTEKTKRSLREYLKRLALDASESDDYSWAESFETVFDQINLALEEKIENLKEIRRQGCS